MISKRPTFPNGYSLPGLPPINKVLHSDENCELYSLSLSAHEATVLFLQPHNGRLLEIDRLRDWWTAQDSQILTLNRLLGSGECPGSSGGAVLGLKGCRIEDRRLADAKEDSLRRLFQAMLDVVTRGSCIAMYPDFNPGLSWFAADETTMCTLLPLSGNTPSDLDQVRLVATAFYGFATGMQPESDQSISPLLRWSKFAGEDLSRLVDRCLAPPGPKLRITTFAYIRNALGYQNGPGPNHLPSLSKRGQASPFVPGLGLDKVAGMHTLKDLLRRDVIEPVRNPEPYRRYGLSIPNGILLYGPPGCGKTYIARQLAEELGHYFVEIIPSEIASPYVHQSVLRIRELFDTAAEQAPAVVFIDEFEALAPQRGELGGHQQYKSEEVNEFLAHLNSCSEKNIFVIAATNQAEKIDSAVRRTGRLDKIIYVGPPDLEARQEMLALHLKDRPASGNLNLASVAQALEGYSASDIRFVVDEAAREALKRLRDIDNESFRSAMTRVSPSVPAEIEAQYKAFEQRGL